MMEKGYDISTLLHLVHISLSLSWKELSEKLAEKLAVA